MVEINHEQDLSILETNVPMCVLVTHLILKLEREFMCEAMN